MAALGFPDTGDERRLRRAPTSRRVATVADGARARQILDEETVFRHDPGARARRCRGWPTGRSRPWSTRSSTTSSGGKSEHPAARPRSSWPQTAAPGFEHLMVYAWRRHLAAAAARRRGARRGRRRSCCRPTMTVGLRRPVAVHVAVQRARRQQPRRAGRELRDPLRRHHHGARRPRHQDARRRGAVRDRRPASRAPAPRSTSSSRSRRAPSCPTSAWAWRPARSSAVWATSTARRSTSRPGCRTSPAATGCWSTHATADGARRRVRHADAAAASAARASATSRRSR